MKLGILGTRGIPNHHGGFEQFAEYFAVYAAQNNWEVYVYNSHLHPYQENQYKGVHIIQAKDLEDKIGTAGQFVYDLNAILDARKRNFDILLQLGYTSNSIWHKLLPKNAIVVTNMDGLEWKRSKYNHYVKRFLKVAEKWAVYSSDYLISDSLGIQEYIQQTYGKSSEYIAYGAQTAFRIQEDYLSQYNLESYGYYMLIARMEPENNIEMILDGYCLSKTNKPFIIIGDATKTKFGKYLLEKYKNNPQIVFLGAIYNLEILDNLRYFSFLYFHGHSVGGTNPSLLEAMASKACIAAHHNQFNKTVLEEDAFYFLSKEEVCSIILKDARPEKFIINNYQKILKQYNWEKINNAYLSFFNKVLNEKNAGKA